jgi:hypothetical protein
MSGEKSRIPDPKILFAKFEREFKGVALLRKIVADIEEFDLIQEGDHMLVELEDDQL